MKGPLFHLSRCPSCERQTDTPGRCPWCDERLPLPRSLRLRLLALAAAAACTLSAAAATPPPSRRLLLFSAILSTVLFARVAATPRRLAELALTALAAAACCRFFPEATARAGQGLRATLVWAVPLTGIVFLADGGVRLPPVPADSRFGRLRQALPAPAFVLTLTLIAGVAAAHPPTAASTAALALVAYAALSGPVQPRLAGAVTLFVWLLCSLAPHPLAEVGRHPHAVPASVLAVWGLAQSHIATKRSGSGSRHLDSL